jgi:hypothetical protein
MKVGSQRTARSVVSLSLLSELSRWTVASPYVRKGFPRHTLRIGDPLLVGSGVAAGGARLLNPRTFGTHKALVDLREFRFILGLNAEMRDTDSSAGELADRRIDSWVVGLDRSRYPGQMSRR